MGGKPRPRRVTFDTVREIALALPGVEEGTSYGTPALRVGRKFFLRLREDRVTLVATVGDDARDALLSADPQTFHVTDHYRGYPIVLVRLSRVDRAELAAIIEQGWRRLAGPRLLAALERAGKL